jgi:cytidylate kinase
MIVQGAFEKARHYIEMRSKKTDEAKLEKGPCITISRETGSGADQVAIHLADILKNYKKDNSRDWTIFDKNLIQKVLEDHHLPQHLAVLMRENSYSAVSSVMQNLFGESHESWDLVHKTSQTILQLSETGNSIIIGRGGNFITAKLKNCFHVRLIANLEDRIKHVEELYNYNKSEAEKFIQKEDQAREKYLKMYFHHNVKDPLIYHMILNTSLLGYRQSAEIISFSIVEKFKELLDVEYYSERNKLF